MAQRALFIPRALVMLASVWVFVSWILLFGFKPPVQPQASTYGPSIQMLMALCGVGIAVAWPMLRLSARPSSAPSAQAALDGVSIFMLLQVVVWPLRLVTSWTLARAIAVDGALAASIMLTSAILAMTQGSASRRTRTAAMLVCVLLAMLPGVVAVIANLTTDPSGMPGDPDGPLPHLIDSLSAPALVARFSEPDTLDPSAGDRILLFRAFAVAAAAWGISIATTLVQRDAASTRQP